ncbi:MAG: peptidyl-prolyl cis-trans isomerase [Gemmatimonadota bacterium]|nr:MAG: peptidyl-prolyl cis-trans isomerase [Gemmatimonadota bacterium]
MFDKKTILYLAVAGTMFIVVVFLIISRGPGGVPSGAMLRELAIALENKELYAQAIEEYENYLSTSRLSHDKRARIHHKIGTIYMDKLHDYENALSAFVKVKHLASEGTLTREVDRRMVECLDRMGRSLDAQQELERATALEEETDQETGGTVVATIGERKVTLEELENKIEGLPPYVREQLQDPQQKIQFLKQYIATELFYDTAKRRGYDRDKEIIQQTFEAKKGLMVERLIAQEIQGTVQIDTADIRLYYKAHKDEYKAPERVRVRHIQASTKAKAQELLNRTKSGEVFEKLAQLESEDVDSRPYGGEIGYVTRDGFVPGIGQSADFANTAFKTKVGKIGGPVQTAAGWHLIKVIEKKEAGQLSYEEAANRVAADLQRQKETEAYQRMVDHALRAENVQIFEDMIPSE